MTPATKIMEAVIEFNRKFGKNPQDIYVNREMFESICQLPVSGGKYCLRVMGFNVWPMLDAKEPIWVK